MVDEKSASARFIADLIDAGWRRAWMTQSPKDQRHTGFGKFEHDDGRTLLIEVFDDGKFQHYPSGSAQTIAGALTECGIQQPTKAA